MDKTTFIVWFGILTAILLTPFLDICASEPTEMASAETPPAAMEKTGGTVELYVFLDDPCGGCGVDNPGCGNCEVIVRYHGIIKRQLGERLYDGTITYRMLNCRMEAHYEIYEKFFDDYGVYEELRGYLPTVFIGTEGKGVFMVGEESLEYVGEVLNAYADGTDTAEIQTEIDARYEKVRQEKAEE